MNDKHANFWPAMGLSSSSKSTYLGFTVPSDSFCRVTPFVSAIGLDWIGLDWIGLDWIGLLMRNVLNILGFDFKPIFK